MYNIHQQTAPVLALLAFVAGMAVASGVQAQTVSVKNNLLYDATLTPNVGAELKGGKHTSWQLFYGWNPWKFSGEKKLRHWSLMPEYRRWLGSRGVFGGWFVGAHLLGGEYNASGVKLPFGMKRQWRDRHYEGWYLGGGLTGGYAWRLSCRWRLEAAVGVGMVHTEFDKYVKGVCGRPLGNSQKNYVGPTKLALNMAYVIGGTCPKAVPVPPVEAELEPVAETVPPIVLAYAVPKLEAEKTRELKGTAFLDFPVNQTDIRVDYRDNARELAKVVETVNVVKDDPNVTITRVSIHGYASPEGSWQNNARLAAGRAQTFKDYVRSLIHLPEAVFSVASTAEDWEGFVRRLEQHTQPTGIDHGDALMAIARSNLAPDEKERRLKAAYPAEWKRLLAEVFPALRHSDYTVCYTIRPFTVEEARALLHSKPQQLSLNELFLVANTYEPGSAAFDEVFLTAVRLYPDDTTANFNAAIIALRHGDLTAAERYLQKAGGTPEAKQAREVLAIKREHPNVQIETK